VLSSVQRAAINENNGSLSTFVSDQNLPSARYYHASTVSDGHILTFGGSNGSAYVNDVIASKYSSTGLGDWKTVNKFPGPRGLFGASAWNGYVVVTGGWQSGGPLRDTQVLQANILPSDGTWVDTESFATPRGYHGTVALNGYLYVIGGYQYGMSPMDNVQVAEIQASGQLDIGWTTTAALNHGRYGHATVIYNGGIYVLGGNTDDQDTHSEFTIPNPSTGAISGWTDTTALPDDLVFHSAVVYTPGAEQTSRVYVMGGFSNTYLTTQDTAYSNTFITNGYLDTQWANQYQDLPSALAGTAAVIDGNSILVTGGTTMDSDRSAAVYRSVIGSGGALGTWEAQTAMPVPRAFHTATLINGNLIVAGGVNGPAYLDDVIVAPLDAFSNVGTWRWVKKLTEPVAYHAADVSGGKLYITGGSDRLSARNTVRFSPLEAP
jgi:N-acetylneuraminic acid mutarotase